MERIIVVSSDPGVTNALLPVVRELLSRGVGIYIIASGPAVKIWQQAQCNCDCNILDDSVSESEAIPIIEEYQPDIVVVGAGAYSMIEHTFRRAASRLGIFCFALLDFWANYGLRFRREQNGNISYSLPDLIGVMDESCYGEMVAEGFDPNKLVIVGAPYLEEAVKYITSASQEEIELLREKFKLNKDIRTFAFFSQSLPRYQSNEVAEYYNDDNLPPWGFTQITILREILRAISGACIQYGVRAQFVLKPHPMEPVVPLVKVLQTTEVSPLVDCCVIEDCDTPRLICLADVVLSMSSTALLEAGLAGKPAFSVQIGMDFAKYPDDFWGNRTGVTVPIYKSLELRQALGKILSTSRPTANIAVRTGFNGSTVKVAETILNCCDVKKNNRCKREA